ncbi:hypothetical protein GDO81_026720 [Engystomops pustulosus]|uniref:Uncharacterized protein n=1 Tax=Engystomops pustulosus TaxID=76066 RepID=A0AAV6YM50_ENGPU|nr:hypothetical protein GDO81_026720 [Engystomops pustulosus]
MSDPKGMRGRKADTEVLRGEWGQPGNSPNGERKVGYEKVEVSYAKSSVQKESDGPQNRRKSPGKARSQTSSTHAGPGAHHWLLAPEIEARKSSDGLDKAASPVLQGGAPADSSSSSPPMIGRLVRGAEWRGSEPHNAGMKM